MPQERTLTFAEFRAEFSRIQDRASRLGSDLDAMVLASARRIAESKELIAQADALLLRDKEAPAITSEEVYRERA